MQSISMAKQLAWAVTAKKIPNFHAARSAVQHFYSGSRAISDPLIIKQLKDLPHISQMIYDYDVIAKFETSFAPWLQKNQWNTVVGLENFEPDLSQGATQSFDSFYIKHANKKWKMFYGEYFYHTLMAVNLKHDWSFISEYSQLEFGDALMLSVPFCDTGSGIPDLDQILLHCDHHGIPVLLDCAYYTIAKNIFVDLNHPCVETVAFSLSKTFPVAHARVGVRYTRPTHKDGQKLHSTINYDNRVSAAIGLAMIDNFSSDWIVNKYQTAYNRLTNLLNLTPGDSIMFADGDDSWQEYSRKQLLETYQLKLDYRLFKNRICLTQLLENLPVVTQCLEDIYEITF